MVEPHTVSAMARETAEIPAAAERLLARADVFAAIVERIEQAKQDWKTGRFAPVPNEHEFIPLPE